jgi:hypothetical protein
MVHLKFLSQETWNCSGLRQAELPPLTAGTIEMNPPSGTPVTSRVADVLVADEDIDVLPHLILLVNDSVADSRTGSPECRQCVGNSSA